MVVCVFVVILATVGLLVHTCEGQCVDCARKIWSTECKTNATGYFCEPKYVIEENYLPAKDYKTSTHDPTDIHAKCVPYPFQMEYVHTYCCFWSKSVGCQIAMHPRVYKSESPTKMCDVCREKCVCNKNYNSAETKRWSNLLHLSLLMFRFF